MVIEIYFAYHRQETSAVNVQPLGGRTLRGRRYMCCMPILSHQSDHIVGPKYQHSNRVLFVNRGGEGILGEDISDNFIGFDLHKLHNFGFYEI